MSTYQAICVDDGLGVIGLMSQSYSLMQETIGCVQLVPHHTELSVSTIQSLFHMINQEKIYMILIY